MMKRFLSLLLVLALAAGLITVSVPALAADNSPDTSAVAYFEVKFHCGCTWNGTGTMIATNAMITAAHNLVCYTHNRGVNTATFYFERDNRKYRTSYNGKFNYHSYADFSRGYESDDDIAYIIFPKDIGSNTGWYASSAESDDDIKWEFCHMIGYNGYKRLYDWEQVEVESSKLISWPASREYREGNQGGPVYYRYEGLEYPVLVAVYITCSNTRAYARRITNNIYSDMERDGAKFN